MSVDFLNQDLNSNLNALISINTLSSIFPKGVVLDTFNQAPSPSKDYCQLYVTTEKVI